MVNNVYRNLKGYQIVLLLINPESMKMLVVENVVG